MEEHMTDNDRKTLKLEKPKQSPKPNDIVTVRVSKPGHQKISTGERHNACDVYYDFKDTFECKRSIAEGLEARHYGEIQ
jgi:hypothetical protein